ncbi:MAG: carbohydrate ABC transporter permease [Clostridia bacterium]|nr:carbohydrate ABC transporter permease [Clostridia bacterium]MBQ8304221.1 carbohydrate ABC transporter permease [Clostridia bacterium]
MAKRKTLNILATVLLILLSALFIFPIAVIVMNSFKTRFEISTTPFVIPSSDTFAGLENYITGITETGFLSAFFYSLFITVFSVLAIVFFTSQTAWYIVRRKTRFTKMLYYAFVFAMVVPFQMVMFTLSKTANFLNLDSPLGLIFIYLGFGAPLSVFLFCGFVKTVPTEIEQAALVDGCGSVRTFFLVVFPLLKPISTTVSVLNAMWIWNDYLLPYLIIGSEYKTIPIAVQYLRGGYGSVDMGALMAVLTLSVIPVVIFYFFGQKFIIEGVAAGAVKG